MLLFLLISTFFAEFSQKDCENGNLEKNNLQELKGAKIFAFCGLIHDKKETTIQKLLEKNSTNLEMIRPIIMTLTSTFRSEDARKKFNLGINLVSSKKYSKARSIFEDLQSNDPFNTDVLYELLKIYETMNLHKKILPFHLKLDGLNPFHGDLHFIVARAALKLDELKIVHRLIEPFRGIPAYQNMWSYLYAESIFRNGEQIKAIALLKELENRDFALNLQLSRMLVTIRKDLPFAKDLLDQICKNDLSEANKIECKQLQSILDNLNLQN